MLYECCYLLFSLQTVAINENQAGTKNRTRISQDTYPEYISGIFDIFLIQSQRLNQKTKKRWILPTLIRYKLKFEVARNFQT
jgi:hypothetical protein